MTDARNGRERPVEQPDDFAQRDVVGRFGQRVAAFDAPFAFEHAAVAQGEENLFEELFGDVRALGDGGNLDEAVGPELRFEADFNQRADGVFTLF